MSRGADHGIDVAALRDLPGNFRLVSGRTNLAYALVRRLSTPRGFLFEAFGDDPDYGYDLRELLNGDTDEASLAAAEGEIAAECKKDPRVQDATCEVTFTRATDTLRIELAIEDADGPFDLVVAVTSLTVELLNTGLAASIASTAPAEGATQVVQIPGPAGPPGPQGAAGASSGSGTASVEFDDNAGTATSSGSEEVLYQVAEDFDALAVGTLTATLIATVRALGGATGTFKLRVGGTDGVADGTVVATLTTTSLTFEKKKATGTIANPTGLAFVKVTGTTSGAGNNAECAGVEATFIKP